MRCLSCGGETTDSTYGPWCSACGGVMRAPGVFYVRHVATANGEGGEFKILYDESTSDYSFSYYRKIKRFVEIKNEWVQEQVLYTKHGTLDEMIALVQPEARGASDGFPALAVGPGAKDEELKIIEL